MAKRALTEKQELFLSVLFDEAEGDPLRAKRIAGYSENVSTSLVTASLSDEIFDLTRKFIAQSSTKAAFTMYKVMGDTDMLGAKEKMAAAKDLMDRAGFAKTEKVEISAKEAVFILPAKKEVEED
tara:strand:- start:297 stop:671 length:375 start_codon:yes stop_codon:yes gene_type:complete